MATVIGLVLRPAGGAAGGYGYGAGALALAGRVQDESGRRAVDFACDAARAALEAYTQRPLPPVRPLSARRPRSGEARRGERLRDSRMPSGAAALMAKHGVRA